MNVMAEKKEEESSRGRRHSFTGKVVSDKTPKTIVVEVERLTRHTRYDKVIKRKSKFYAHDEKNEAHLGDLVEIISARKMSKLKRWRLVKIVKKAVTLDTNKTDKEVAA